MAVQSHSPARHQEGIKRLIESMEALEIKVTEALDGRPQAPREINGRQPDVFGTAGSRSALGVVAFVDELPRTPLKDWLHHLPSWAKDPGADLFLGLIGEPAKGFSGMEQGLELDQLKRLGWFIIPV